MLGVPGDIQLKTLFHGIHLAFITMSLRRCRCIGDDAKAYMTFRTPLDLLVFHHRLMNLGNVALDKTELFEFDDGDEYELSTWHYAKRPIVRSYNRLFSYFVGIFPTLDCLLGLQDPRRTSSGNDLISRRNKFSNIWLRLLTVLHVESGGISAEDRRLLWLYQNEGARQLGILGYRPGLHRVKDQKFLVPPLMHEEEFGDDPVWVVLSQYEFEEEIEVQMEGRQVTYHRGYVGDVFSSKESALLGFMVKMGILSRKTMFEVISRKLVGDHSFGLRVLGRFDFLYEYQIVRPIPTWMFTLMPGL